MGTDKLTGTTWLGFNKITGNLAFLTNYRKCAPDAKMGTGLAICLFKGPLEDLSISARILRRLFETTKSKKVFA